MTPNTPFSDDELGAMLGRSVQSKVDDVPTITPSFDGIERRARQITNRRRTAAGLAVGALALFGGLGAASLFTDEEEGLENDVVTDPEQIVVDDETEPIEETEPEPQPEPEPEPTIGDAEPEAEPAEPEDTQSEAPADDDQVADDPDPVVVATPWMDPALLGIIDIESDTNIDDVGPVPAPMVGFDENDTVWVATPVGDGRTSQAAIWQVDGLRTVRYVEDPTIDGDQHFVFDLGERIVHVNEDKQARVIADAAYLVGAEMRLGRPTAYVADLPISAGGAVEVGDLYSIDLLTGERLGLVTGASTTDSVVRDVVLGERTTFVEFGGVDGSNLLLGVADPASAPAGFGIADAATLSVDDTTLYWLNQVEVGADLRPSLELTVADVATGATETVVFDLPATQVALDYDISPLGDELLLVRSWPGGLENGRQTTSYGAPLLLAPATGEITELALEFGFWKPVAN
ncbi:MAG: hypothetical protein AAGE98_15845 [Actinomycetota bacterium]